MIKLSNVPRLPLTILIFFFINRSYAQDKKQIRLIPNYGNDSLLYSRDSVVQKDMGDVINGIFHKNSKRVAKKDSITSKVVKSFVPAIGYTLTTGFVVSISGNLEFRVTPQDRISNITTSAALSSKKQFTVPIESTIWTNKGDYVFIGDDRFYNYRQSTFGLGSNSNIADEDPMKYIYVRLSETVLRHIAGNFFLGGGYMFDYHGNISDMGNTNGTNSAYRMYESATHTISSGYTINGLLDSRDNPISPVRGYFAAFQYRDSYHFLGSTSSWRSLILDWRHYIRLSENSDNVLALWSYNWLVLSGKAPYLDLPANSWDPYSSTGRGYIQGRFRGAQMVYLESEYRFKITANGLIGGVVFANAESLSGTLGTHLQNFQPGFGPGLRVKLNKVSKTNICIDYGFGRQGSRGLSVNVGELF